MVFLLIDHRIDYFILTMMICKLKELQKNYAQKLSD